MQFTLIQNGELYSPQADGVQSILLAGEKIARIGDLSADALRHLGVEYEVVDVSDCIVIPGLIDPHAHLIGGGEEGFISRTPEISFDELVKAGITTVVGCLGTDVITRQLNTLLGKVRQLNEQGITAYMHTGGFKVPPVTICGSVMDDLVLIDRIIGVGEIAISDNRASEPSLHELARVVSDSYVGGLLSGKAGVTHFHTGPGKSHLKLLHNLLDNNDLPAQCLYPTHIARSEKLMDDAIALAARGAYVDMDTVDEQASRWLHYYVQHKGVMDKLTISSDANTPGGSPAKFFNQFISSLRESGLPLEQVLPCFSSNAATVLKLPMKGQLREGMDADIVILHKDSFDLLHVFARGTHVVNNREVQYERQP